MTGFAPCTCMMLKKASGLYHALLRGTGEIVLGEFPMAKVPGDTLVCTFESNQILSMSQGFITFNKSCKCQRSHDFKII